MALLSIAQYTRNKNIRQSLPFNKSTNLYYLKFEWVDEKKLDELFPITPIPEENNRSKQLLSRFFKK